MTPVRRLTNAFAAGTLGLTIAAAPALAMPPNLQEWANQVWAAAQDDGAAAVRDALGEMPAEGTGDRGDAIIQSLARLQVQQTEADDARQAKRTEAIDKMREELGSGNKSLALRQAVIAQTQSADFDAAFTEEEIMDVVDWAEEQYRVDLDERSWIDAQEHLYLLKTFYEDTDRRERYRELKDELDRVNHRVSLLARYAPRVLHDLRADRAEEMGEEDFPEYNPVNEIDFEERLRGINHRLLFASMATAAREHIENEGWRPLLEGGLEAIELLATTTSLETTFPSLADARMVGQFVEAIRDARREVAESSDRELNARYCSAMVNELIRANMDSIDLPVEMVLREFGDGAMAKLDTYSDIVWPDELRRFEQQTAGDFVGVGILIRHGDRKEIIVVNPLEGTPAYQAGVRPQDVITEVDGDSTAGWSLNDAVDQITGQRGKRVVLGVKREGEDESIQIPIIRDVIKIHSVKGWRKVGVLEDGEPVWDWYIDPDSGIAYIRLTQFTNSTFEDLIDAWMSISAVGRPNGLVLDLRHNPGGLLTASVNIANLFVKRGEIVTGEDRDQRQVWGRRAQTHLAALAGLPTVVLINRGSASASEIVAGSLQAHGAAVIVGERSFGKGSVQTVHQIDAEGRLKLTTQYYRLPSDDEGVTPGRLVHKRPGSDVWGVDPDVLIPMTVNQVSDAINLRQEAEMMRFGEDEAEAAERPDIDELLTRGLDPQLQTALLILQAQALAADDGATRHAAGQATGSSGS